MLLMSFIIISRGAKATRVIKTIESPPKRRNRPTHSSVQTVEPLIQRHPDIEEEERKSLTPFNYTHIFHVIYIGFLHLESPIQYCVTPKFIAAVIVFV